MLNPSDADATFFRSTRTQTNLETFKPCHVGIHWKAFAEYLQMSTHVPGFQLFFRLFHIILYRPN